MDERDIRSKLIGYLRYTPGTLIMPNVFVQGSPWESDVISVTKAFYWTEYEIKVTLSDYRADFGKAVSRYRKSITKHGVYASGDEVRIPHRSSFPKPKRFYFVVPVGLLRDVDVPDHCGVMEASDDGRWGISTVRSAPILPGHRKLGERAIFLLAVKATRRYSFSLQDRQ
jgi:hypothetical protein